MFCFHLFIILQRIQITALCKSNFKVYKCTVWTNKYSFRLIFFILVFIHDAPGLCRQCHTNVGMSVCLCIIKADLKFHLFFPFLCKPLFFNARFLTSSYTRTHIFLVLFSGTRIYIHSALCCNL